MQKIRKKRLVYFIFCAMFWFTKYRNVVQPGRTLRSGRRSRRFESSHSDQIKKESACLALFLFDTGIGVWTSGEGGSTTSERRAEERRWAKRMSACATQAQRRVISHSDQPRGGSGQFGPCRRYKKYVKSRFIRLFFFIWYWNLNLPLNPDMIRPFL